MALFDHDGEGPDLRYRMNGDQLVSHGTIFTREAKKRRKLRNIAVLDVETDPFDNVRKDPVFPFLAVVYSDQFPTISIWENDWRLLVQKLVEELAKLPEPFTIYAHNGGRFDYMYFMHLIDGACKFKGRSLMSAKLCHHEVRDSLHIIPEALRNANRKTDIDYKLFHRDHREQHRAEITQYCLDDCVATFEIVRAFIDKFAMPLTIGQAAMKELQRHYTFKKLSEPVDRYMRQWFFGGRVECIARPGRYDGPLKLFDVNSMYPAVMSAVKHPIGDEFFINDRVSQKTAFIHLRCRNRGALVSRLPSGELSTQQIHGEFFTTVHEYHKAKELKLISDITIIKTVDFWEWTTFHDFVKPLYDRREALAQALLTKNVEFLEREGFHAASEPWDTIIRKVEMERKFLKYLLNNAYGKFAQNPRRFKNYYITQAGEAPPKEWLFFGAEIEARRTDGPSDPKDMVFHRNRLNSMSAEEKESYWRDRVTMVKVSRSHPEMECNGYNVWGIPSPDWRFNNVATAACITGAARAVLLEARHRCDTPLYCDTDSLICRGLGGLTLDATKLGAWKLEAEIESFIMGGKKLYGYRTVTGKEVIRAKGQNGVTWLDLEAIIQGAVIEKTMTAPTISRTQGQVYQTRKMRMTA